MAYNQQKTARIFSALPVKSLEINKKIGKEKSD